MIESKQEQAPQIELCKSCVKAPCIQKKVSFWNKVFALPAGTLKIDPGRVDHETVFVKPPAASVNSTGKVTNGEKRILYCVMSREERKP